MPKQQTAELKPFFHNKTVLVTGGTGSIGSQIVKRLLLLTPKQVIVFSKDDSKQYVMSQKYAEDKRLFFVLGDVRDHRRVNQVMKGVDIVFHAAALKQVPTCEDHPFEAIQTNLIGGQNVVEAALLHRVQHVINISTDKAVSPVNTMGATKLLSEKLFHQANRHVQNKGTVFCSVRFGNVLGSRGSVIPILFEQMMEGQPLTITDKNMTRFFMSIDDAATLTLQSAAITKGGETFIFKMESLKLEELIHGFEEYASQHGLPRPAAVEVGKRPGEKLHEELTSPHEIESLYEWGNLYAILPEPEKHPDFRKVNLPGYQSDQAPLITKERIAQIIEDLHQEKKA
ncbi:nucleoside-diphosphate sugar epimerase/dehydratase [Bacillus stercoris]|uniref:SDR family NAD(P)-dependent oxidoreductase n=1 Tax=Bacillus TaxID=1386 RepID=UPI00155A6586|nr:MULTISPECIES: nucleoside-diphosphate sugar epimerase/dehydratase [Bacillus]NLS87008.1 polysaccharide biosynthesis protein [Bacillus subtilis]MDN0190324.1 polysaccharide biosynthesis protein [Bacillus sp. B.PNR1]MDN3033630.1 nucleoside-diphosphate sugar epimerase/dehydratase [Bacillus sp. B.PNR2]WGV93673.1 nucleoside-diphosphate sugar epimerase/dehydratase [Bacillus stercoris]WGV97456.1 nucleoside-diphosphate sugar epimerase/dehydratase [Bacillus stercoris]